MTKRKDCYSYISRINGHNVANDVRYKEKQKNYSPDDEYDATIFKKGEQWCDEGMELEDAPENLKNNRNFIYGFERAKRLKNVTEYQYNLGISFYQDGILLEQIPEKYRDNPTVIKGYEDAKNNRITLGSDSKGPVRR